MLPRLSHHREPVLNHMDPVNLRHGLRCTADASPFAMTAWREALCCDHLNLAYSQMYASTNPDCSCLGGDTWRRHIGLLWERLSQFVNLGLLFSAAAHERHTGACNNLSTWCRTVSASSQHLPPLLCVLVRVRILPCGSDRVSSTGYWQNIHDSFCPTAAKKGLQLTRVWSTTNINHFQPLFNITGLCLSL